jgi:hypothetical protein
MSIHKDNLFIKICDNFEVSWCPAELTKDWQVVREMEYKVITDPSGTPHWQDIGNLLFGRNFPEAYPDQAKEVLDGLKQLQEKLRSNPPISKLVETFLNHRLELDRINLTKIKSGFSCVTHFDRSRSAVINIGVINSPVCLTHAWSMDGPMVPVTLYNERSVKYTYQHQDNEVYLLNTNIPHGIESLVRPEDNLDRYVIGYLLEDRDPTLDFAGNPTTELIIVNH